MEDQIIVESQMGEVRNTTEECNVPSDEASLQFRRWNYREVK